MKENQENMKKDQNDDLEKSRRIEDETNFANALTDPIRVFGSIYPYFIVVLVAAGIFWLNNLDVSFDNQTDEFIPPEITQKEGISMKKGSQVAGVNLEEIANPSQELISTGADLYNANCASCHGDQGFGDGAAGAALNPAPRNFHDGEDWVNGHDIAGMYKTLQEGIVENGMAPYDYMPVKDRFAIIYYIRDMADFYEDVTMEELETLNQQYKLTEGSIAPNTIPVELAIDILSNEGKSMEAQITSILDRIEKSKSEPGYELFHELYKDNRKVVSTLMQNVKWRESREEFVKVLYSTFPDNGFKSKVFRITDTELTTLHTFVSKLIPPKNVSQSNESDDIV